MRDWFRRTGALVSGNVSSIIAMSSLMIAGFSLYLTIHAQSQDRAYKELMIKPALALGADTVDFSLFLSNDGLGPAEIRNVVYYFNGRCLSMLQPDGININRAEYMEVSQAIKTRVLNDTFSLPIFEPFEALDTKVKVLLPDSIIGSGKEWVLFKIDESTLSEFRNKIDRMETHFAKSLKYRFLTQALTLPIALKYCSVSGNYCQTNLREKTTEVPCRLGP